MRNNKLILEIIKTDNTFKPVVLKGKDVMTGKCIHCRSHIYITMDGGLIGKATIEHIVPKNKGGTNDVENLALACKSCNNQKGRTADKLHESDPKYQKMVKYLMEQKEKRKR